MLRLRHLRWAPLAAVPIGFAVMTTINDEVGVAGRRTSFVFVVYSYLCNIQRLRPHEHSCSGVLVTVGQRATPRAAPAAARAKREAADFGHGLGGT
jgi:hypothetical protein